MEKTEKVREILRNIGIEMFDVFMEDEAKKQKQPVALVDSIKTIHINVEVER